ncbi:MAG TPA: hypothetical protein VKD90_15200 [Gemmataceae bacterium]|nr:hypothetical protein [Gemmataceae bacterium]
MKPTVLLLVLTLALVPAGADDKKDDKKPADSPAAKLPLGRDTTYVVGPLDKHGYVDYEAALNAELGRGVTRENNANVLLWEVFGPRPEGAEMPTGYFKWLDAPAPPPGGAYLVGMHTLFREQFGLTDAQLEAVYEVQSRSTQWPWVPKDCPPLAEWLKLNEKPLARAAKAVERPHYFNPLVTRRKEDEPGSLIGALLPGVQKCRELASAFTARATLRVGEGKFDEAWADILACHRLGRHVSRGGTLIEGLVGVAVCQIAHNATLVYLDRAKLTSGQAAARLKDLRDLPKLAPLADKIDITERFMGLESVQNFSRTGTGGRFLFSEVFGENRKPSAAERKALEVIDWTPVMKSMNGWYDRMAAAMRMKDRATREKEFDAIEKDLAGIKKEVTGEKLSRQLLAKDGPGEAVGKAIGDVLMALLMPAVRKVHTAYDRAEQAERNLHVALALAAYHAENGRYPAELADLAPDYLAAVPGDVFSGKPLIYKPSAKGYLFYSVGPNGQDDGGNSYDDDPPGDDPRVRMPLPEPKRNP